VFITKLQGGNTIPVITLELCFIVFYVLKFSFLPFIPKLVFASLLMSQGLSMLHAWFFLPLFRIPRAEWCIIALILGEMRSLWHVTAVSFWHE
jgi:MFS superfamily sulfate permease-like transporter